MARRGSLVGAGAVLGGALVSYGMVQTSLLGGGEGSGEQVWVVQARVGGGVLVEARVRASSRAAAIRAAKLGRDIVWVGPATRSLFPGSP